MVRLRNRDVFFHARPWLVRFPPNTFPLKPLVQKGMRGSRASLNACLLIKRPWSVRGGPLHPFYVCVCACVCLCACACACVPVRVLWLGDANDSIAENWALPLGLGPPRAWPSAQTQLHKDKHRSCLANTSARALCAHPQFRRTKRRAPQGLLRRTPRVEETCREGAHGRHVQSWVLTVLPRGEAQSTTRGPGQAANLDSLIRPHDSGGKQMVCRSLGTQLYAAVSRLYKNGKAWDGQLRRQPAAHSGQRSPSDWALVAGRPC